MLRRWNELPPRPRAIAVGAAAALAVLACMVPLCVRDSRVGLFAMRLVPEQVAEVDAQLAAWGEPHAIGPDGVRVDPRHRADLLVRLAAAGVPHAHLEGTIESLAALGALTPQTILDARARAGLEGDLARALRGLDGIVDARVLIAPAHLGTFADEPSSDASASVRIVTPQGAPAPSAAVVTAVKTFVASAVPGLRAERVAVIDERGAAPVNPPVDDAGARERAVQSVLDGAFGADAAIVRVHLARGGRAAVAVAVDAHRGLDLAKIAELTRGAAGLDTARGDTLRVEAVPFDRPRAPLRSWNGPLIAAIEAVPALGAVAVALIALRVGARPLRDIAAAVARRSRSAQTAVEVERLPFEPRAIRAALRGESLGAAAAMLARLPAPVVAAVLELYSPPERETIVRRLARPLSPLVPDPETFFTHG